MIGHEWESSVILTFTLYFLPGMSNVVVLFYISYVFLSCYCYIFLVVIKFISFRANSIVKYE